MWPHTHSGKKVRQWSINQSVFDPVIARVCPVRSLVVFKLSLAVWWLICFREILAGGCDTCWHSYKALFSSRFISSFLSWHPGLLDCMHHTCCTCSVCDVCTGMSAMFSGAFAKEISSTCCLHFQHFPRRLSASLQAYWLLNLQDRREGRETPHLFSTPRVDPLLPRHM